MARKYVHIQNYEKGIKKMLEEVLTQREIGEALKFSKERAHGFVKRLHAKERKIAAGEALRKRADLQRSTRQQRRIKSAN